MVIQLPTLEEIKEIARASLRTNFPLYQEEHKVDASSIPTSFIYKEHNNLWIGYRTRDRNILETMNSTYFDLNVIGDICYLVEIALDKNERGKGLGWRLYEITHDIAKKLGCDSVRQTPSGGFIKDRKMIQSRRDYLLKRGYVPAGEWELDWMLD